MPASRSSPFLSPISKLVRFFQRSRDKWKEKCKTAKRQNKSLRLCLAKMKESRDRWKDLATRLDEGKVASAGSRTGRVKKRSFPQRAGMPPHAICPR